MSAPAPEAATTSLEFRILGPMEVLRDGLPLELGPRRHRALLALLVLDANRVLSADRLVQELWAGHPPEGAAKTLRSYMSRLRAVLGHGVVLSRAPGYVLDAEPDQVDAQRFEHLFHQGLEARARGAPEDAAARFREALGLWRGGALADLVDEPFAGVEAGRLEELRLVAVEERIDAELETGRHRELVAELEALVAEQPLRERLWGQLMTALYRGGRQADALAAYQRARRMLADRLGLEAGEELRALEQQILRQELAPAHGPTRPFPSGTVTFLFSEVADADRLLGELGAQYRNELDEHRRVLQAVFARHGGVEVEAQGAGFFVAFATAHDATAAAREAQEALATGPVRVQVGLHTGEPMLTEDGYLGVDVHRASRIMDIAHGGQVLLSQATRELLDATVDVRDLGVHRVEGLSDPLHLYQLGTADFPPLRTVPRTNLPAQLTSFVGREREREELAALIPGTPLVTLTGVGGCGKTRLALEAARRALPDFRDGVHVAELATLTKPQFVADAVAGALGAPERGERPMTDLLAEYLRSQSLLVLDNCEHLLEACASLVTRLLSTCPGLRVLATSREPLGVPGERVYRLQPLPVPDRGDSPVDPAGSDAVTLFLERAAATGWEPDTSAETLETIASICRELDGLPLALELAAARTQVLSVGEIAARLDDRFRFLRSSRGSHEPRHETLGATMAWSYGLLTEDERALLARLSVFAGGFTLVTAAIVCLRGDTDSTLELLTRLVQASLVLVDATGKKARYHMLETVRRYAAERLAERGETQETRDRHAECFAGDPKDVARFWPAEGWGTKLFLRTTVDLDNLRAALDWASERESPLELPLAIKYQRADAVLPAEGRARLTRALASPAPNPPQLRARALAAAGGLARIQGDLAAAGRALHDSLRLYRASGDYEGEIVVLARLEEVAIESGAELDVLRVAEDAERLARGMDDPVMLSAALTRRAIRALAVGERGAARSLLDESLAALDTVRERASSRAELSLAYRAGDAHTLRAVLELIDGDLERALNEAEAGLEAFSEIGEDYAGQWDSVDVLAAALAHAGDVETAVRLDAAVGRHRETRGEQVPWVLASVREKTHGGIERALAEPELAAAAAQGRSMSLREAIATALSAANRIASSPRERPAD